MFSPQAGRRQPCPLPPHTPSSSCHFNALRAIAGGNPAKEWARNGFATPSDGFQSNSGYRLPLDLMHGKLARGSLTESTGDYRRRRVRGRLTDTRAVKGRSGIPPFGGHFVHKHGVSRTAGVLVQESKSSVTKSRSWLRAGTARKAPRTSQFSSSFCKLDSLQLSYQAIRWSLCRQMRPELEEIETCGAVCRVNSPRSSAQPLCLPTRPAGAPQMSSTGPEGRKHLGGEIGCVMDRKQANAANRLKNHLPFPAAYPGLPSTLGRNRIGA